MLKLNWLLCAWLLLCVAACSDGGGGGAKRGDETGSLAPGKSADFIVLGRNLFEIPAQEISETRVLSTVVSGREVHRAEA